MPWARSATSVLALRERSVGPALDGRPRQFGALLERLHVLDQRGGTRGGGLQCTVRHLVGDGAVDLVTEPGEHG